jgi:exosortase A-associated hydrolase 2
LKTLQHAFFLPVEGGACFCIYRRPEKGPVAGTVLHLPAFGDEMNKSRAMTARAARALAARGFGVLQLDLLGCGDSSGDHGDASVGAWIDNAQRGLDWLAREGRTVAAPWLWCLRAGALLVAPLLQGPARDAPLLLWQPVLSGAQQLNNLLRQKLAGALGAGERVDAKSLRQRWIDGETQEIGGYAIAPRLAQELEQAAFDIPAGYRGRVEWFEVSPTAAPAISPAGQNRIAGFRSIGISINAMALHGPGFWQSVEIEQCEGLIEASSASLTIERRHGSLRDPVEL